MSRWLHLAHKTALAFGRHSHFLVGAVAIKGGAVLGTEANFARKAFPALQAGHAEERLVNRLRDSARGATVYVVRHNKKMSRPCPRCWAALVRSGVSRVVYLDWLGQTVTEKVA